MRPILLLTLLLGLIQSLDAQTGILRGTVTDAETQAPLPGATIQVVGTYTGGFSNEAGVFELRNLKPGDYTVKISYVGYSERLYNGIRIAAGQPVTLDVALNSVVSTLGEVEIVGQRTLIDLESGQSSVRIGEEVLSEINVKNVQDVVAMQAGVNKTPDGIQIRGGRVYETDYLVEGINASDPLAGTGFGLDVSAKAVKDIQVVTSGAAAEFGGGGSGVILTRIREGSDRFAWNASWTRDNLGFRVNEGPSWNTDDVNLSFEGPIYKKTLTFFVGGSMFLSDEYFRATADQLHSSLFTQNDSFWAPRQDNRWSNTVKLAWNIRQGLKLTFTNQHSLNINQSTRSLQIIGNDAVVQPGFQYEYSLDLDNANTYTHHSNLSVLNLRTILGEQWSLDASLGRLFTNLRADANGRPFRSETVDQLFDPASIVTDPVAVFNALDSIVYVFPGPGLVNNGGIATLWHDHYAIENTGKVKLTWESASKVHHLTFGAEHKDQEYQWIDVTRPWVGAPIRINDTLSTPSTRLGRSSDFWKVRPATGGLFFEDEIQYKGIIAVLGARLNYWAPGAFADQAVADPRAPVLDAVRNAYQDETFGLFGLRWKARLLPRLRVSFPVTENNVLYFNYSHAMRLPHPRFVYAGLDPVYQDRSFLSNLGNPNINPEVTVSYELGLKSQLTRDWALSVTAFYNDKFDYIVSRRVEVLDATGRFVEKTFFINQDYARIRGLEAGLTRRVGTWFTGTFNAAYQIATGKSNTAAESALQIRQQGFVNATKEQYLAWDRPLDLKLLLILTPDATVYLGSIPMDGFRFSLTGTWKSGLRYTPHTVARINPESGRPEYEPIEDQPFSRVGAAWFWMDARLSRDFSFGRDHALSLSFELKNLTNYRSAAIINPVTGRAYREGDPLPLSFRDPSYPDPQDRGIPPFNPARFLEPRQMLFGIQIR
ncbi:MAG: TonB-dependent receptor [Bacteroidia bacterium]|nr:TonB-dependent receptor [Bacteroidia bacterium]